MDRSVYTKAERLAWVAYWMAEQRYGLKLDRVGGYTVNGVGANGKSWHPLLKKTGNHWRSTL